MPRQPRTDREEFYAMIRSRYVGCDVSFALSGPLVVSLVLPEWCDQEHVDLVRRDLETLLMVSCLPYGDPFVSIRKGKDADL